MLALLRLAALVLAAFLAACAQLPPRPGATTSATLTPVAFSALPGWGTDRVAKGVAAFTDACARLALLPPDEALGGAGEAARLGGKAGQWSAACAAARALAPGDDAAARRFAETYLAAYEVSSGGSASALFTGYYEPEVAGSRSPGRKYPVPLLRRPDDLVQADLDQFIADPKTAHIVGRVSGAHLVPYYTRSEIEHGALRKDRYALVWLASPVDAFFLQVQGAGRVRLPKGQIVRVGYAAQNGRTYVPIGKLLIKRGALTPDQVSEQSIRAWLEAHPDQAQDLMDENPSYVFFRELPHLAADEGPPGTLGVPLSPERAVAIDRTAVPLGAPVWIDTTDPVDGSAFQHLMVAEDTGGAITGPLRADIFFGWGTSAEARAGRMRNHGHLYILLPRPFAKSAS